MYREMTQLILGSTLLTSMAFANVVPPSPDGNGDYTSGARGWYYWQVTDNDPAGLNCRATREFADGYWILSDDLRDDIQNFPVLRRFPLGTLLIVNYAPAGFALWHDDAGKPWLRVSLARDSDSMCFVRAHSRYVRPISTSWD